MGKKENKTDGKALARYDHLYNRLDSNLKKIFNNALNQQMYTWRNSVMNRKNCPSKISGFLNGQIKAKYILDFVFKKGISSKIEAIQLSNQQMNKLRNHFLKDQNRHKSDQETEKIIQILYDHLPIFPLMCRLQCYGQEPLSDQLVDYFNQEFKNFQTAPKFTKKIAKRNTWTVKDLMKPYQKKIRKRQQKQIDQQKRKMWIQIEEEEKDIKFIPAGYKKELIQICSSKFNETQADKNNGMEFFRNIIQEYIDPIFPLKYGRKCENNDRYFPKNITTEILKKRSLQIQIQKPEKQWQPTHAATIENMQPDQKKQKKRSEKRKKNLEDMRISEKSLIDVQEEAQKKLIRKKVKLSLLNNFNIRVNKQSKERLQNKEDQLVVIDDQEASMMILESHPTAKETNQQQENLTVHFSPGRQRFNLSRQDIQQNYVQRLPLRILTSQRQSFTELQFFYQEQTHRVSQSDKIYDNRRGIESFFCEEDSNGFIPLRISSPNIGMNSQAFYKQNNNWFTD